MSVTDLTTEPEVAAPPPAAPAAAQGPRAAWLRVALACAALLVSGAVRWRQSAVVGARMDEERRSPFPLDELPLTLGDWRGEVTVPDPKIVRAVGATDYTFRRYVNQATGVAVEVYVLYGPAIDLVNHVPEMCYPAAGFALREGPSERTVEAGAVRAPFRTLVFGRGEGGQSHSLEVYYSRRFKGRWSPETGSYKQLERIPGMYKVQLSRRVTERERREIGSPSEAFLRALLAEIERRQKRPQAAPGP